jgi:hypothetical protein
MQSLCQVHILYIVVLNDLCASFFFINKSLPQCISFALCNTQPPVKNTHARSLRTAHYATPRNTTQQHHFAQHHTASHNATTTQLYTLHYIITNIYTIAHFFLHYLKEIRDNMQLVSSPNVFPYQKFIETEKAGYLVRQYFLNNLYDRIR